MSEEDLRVYVSQLAGRIEGSFYGPDRIDLSSGIHLTGGEPFLNFELLVRGAEILTEFAIPSTFVETNCGWCEDDDQTRRRLIRLKQAGLVGIMISVNPFILEYVPFERTQRAIRISREVFGANAIVYQEYYYRSFTRLGVAGKMRFEEYMERTAGEGLHHAEVITMGRICYSLGHLFRRRPAEAFFARRCGWRLSSPHHVHIDNYGNYMGGFCGGISLGDAHELDSIFSGVDLERHRVIGAVVKGIGGLYQLGKEFGYEDLAEGYVSACHLCMDIRRHFVQRTEERFEELQPRELYLRI